jgi:hypothetical protein
MSDIFVETTAPQQLGEADGATKVSAGSTRRESSRGYVLLSPNSPGLTRLIAAADIRVNQP